MWGIVTYNESLGNSLSKTVCFMPTGHTILWYGNIDVWKINLCLDVCKMLETKLPSTNK